MSSINVLSQDVINKIAAGEVVERPASVVKELIENSIDAGATEITLNIENGGLTKIEVVDNGAGMDETDARMALQQHATSKLLTEADLESIDTLGFRGEALASIASVSDTTIHTYNGSNQPYQSFTKNGDIICELGKGRAKGTTVSVNNIFSRIPARRKFLKSPATEYKYIVNTFTSIALSHPTISFKLVKDGKIQLLLTKDDTATSRITKLFPAYKAEDLIPITYDSPKIKITGYIGHPSKARPDNSIQYTFINKRAVKDGLIGKAVKDAFSSTLMNHNYPIYFLYYEIALNELDVNIHPRKLEVRYSDPSSVFMATKIAIEKSLQNALKTELLRKTDSMAVGSSTIKPNFGLKSYKGTIEQSISFSRDLLEPMRAVSRPEYTVEHSMQNTEGAHTPIISQFFNTYIIFQKDDKLLIVDQHAADERVNYEKLLKRLANKTELGSSDLLIPITIQLSPSQLETVKTSRNRLSELGFKFSITKSSVKLEALPEIFKNNMPDDAFIELINSLKSEDGEIKSTNNITKKQNRLIATMACHSSIRAGQKLTIAEMQQLITNLFNCELPYSCPHGRPIIWELTRYELEKNFKRKI